MQRSLVNANKVAVGLLASINFTSKMAQLKKGNRMMETNKHIKTSYDDIADVMYLTSEHIVHTKNKEDEAGLVLRYDLKTHKLIGVTIIDYKEYWLPKRKHLVRRISNYFNVSVEDADRIIQPSTSDLRSTLIQHHL